MNHFDEELAVRLDLLRQAGLWRELRRIDSAQGTRVRIGGREFLNFSSNDYLGLANHPALHEAAHRALRDFGAGAGASRLISGSLAPAHGLEESLAAFQKTAAALTFNTGYAAAVGTITALLDRQDVIVVDRLVHACCIDAARLSGAKLRVFAHNDLDELESILKWADERCQHAPSGTRPRRGRILIVTESVFSMDGDCCPLPALIELKDRHGAWLMLDEAHATGMFGEHRRGLADALQLSDRIEIHLGTLGKAVGAAGGYIAGSRPLIDLLINRARTFIFSTAPVPAAAAAAQAGIELIAGTEGARRCQQLWERVSHLATRLPDAGWPAGTAASPIRPLLVGDESAAVQLAGALREQNLFVPAIRHPTVPRRQARLRVTLSADHTPDDIVHLTTRLQELRPAHLPPHLP